MRSTSKSSLECLKGLSVVQISIKNVLTEIKVNLSLFDVLSKHFGMVNSKFSA